jgi:hypothetical protein
VTQRGRVADTLTISLRAFASACTAVGCGNFLLAGALKLTRRGRDSASTTALAALLPARLTDVFPAVWVTTSLAEIGVGIGLLTRRRLAAPAACVLASSALGYTAIAAWRTPQRPCGCLGAASRAPVRESVPRAVALTAISTAPLLVSGAVARLPIARNERVERASVAAFAVTLSAVMVALSPERRGLVAGIRAKRLAKQLRNGDAVLRALAVSRTWKTVAPLVASADRPTHWDADGKHYIAFPARARTTASTVAIMAYSDDDRLRFRAALVRDDTGEVLLRV